jgi:hypothetical protein
MPGVCRPRLLTRAEMLLCFIPATDNRPDCERIADLNAENLLAIVPDLRCTLVQRDNHQPVPIVAQLGGGRGQTVLPPGCPGVLRCGGLF